MVISITEFLKIDKKRGVVLNEKTVIFLIGKPCAGKEYTLEQLQTFYPDMCAVHVSSETLRQYKGELLTKIKAIQFRGDLVPGEMVAPVVFGRVQEDSSNKIIIDGSPRTIPEAEALHECFSREGIVCVQFLLETSDDCVMENLLQRIDKKKRAGQVLRDDDDPVKMKEKRLPLFQSETLPAVLRFEELGVKTIRLEAGFGNCAVVNAHRIAEVMLKDFFCCSVD